MILLGFVLLLSGSFVSLIPPYLTMPIMNDVLVPRVKGEPVEFQLGLVLSFRVGRGFDVELALDLGQNLRLGLGQRTNRRRFAKPDLLPICNRFRWNITAANAPAT